MQITKLGDIAIEVRSSNKGDKRGCKIVGLEHLTPSEVTLSLWSENSENTFTKEFSKGDVLFGRRRAYLKKASVASFDGICSGDITVIRAKGDMVDPQLLPFIIQNDFFFNYAVEKSAGSLSPRVKWEHLKNFEVNLPDKREQRLLADTLWSINQTKQSYQTLIKQTDELVKSQFIEIANTALKESRLTDICRPKQWPTIAKQYFTEDGYPVFGANGHIGFYTEYNHEEPTITIACRGASCGAINVTPEKTYINGNAMCLDNVSEELNLIYLEYALRTKDFSDVITGSAQPQITANNLDKVVIKIPDSHTQMRFAVFAEQSDKSKFAMKDAIDNLDALSKKIIAENLIIKGKED